MRDLFTSQLGRICIHNATNTRCLIKKISWYKGELSYDVLVPDKDEKGIIRLCHATYSDREIKVL